MNKTVNINLAGIPFYIDEDAYGKLSRYLEGIRNSLKGSEGSEEIMQDIEARIAELFTEKMENTPKVVTMKTLDEVIAVMGQPEDYEVDDDVFDDVPPTSKAYGRHKKLFRDIDDKYISGVSSGLGHYVGVDAIWIRLLWVLLVLAGLGSPILVYILLWILVPAAVTTSDKLRMTGEPINISNIERKFKEGFDTVADKVKNVDYDKYGNKIKTGTSNFFDALGQVFLTLFKVFAKLIGLVIIIVSLLTIISLVVSFFAFGSIDFWGNTEMMEYFTMIDTTNVPLWLVALLVLFAVGIPFFVLFILGLKLLISNLKSMGSTAKIVLIVVWALSIIGLAIIGIKQATENAYDGSHIEEQSLLIQPNDTIHLSIRADKQFGYTVSKSGGMSIKYTAEDKRVIYSSDISINIKSSTDSVGKIVLDKSAEGSNHLDAKKRAEAIEYYYSFENNRLLLDGFFVTDPNNKYRDQQIEITLYIPEGTVLYSDASVTSYYGFNSEIAEMSNWDNQSHYYRLEKNRLECLDCSKIEKEIENKTDSLQVERSIDSLQVTKPLPSRSWEEEVKEDFKDI